MTGVGAAAAAAAAMRTAPTTSWRWHAAVAAHSGAASLVTRALLGFAGVGLASGRRPGYILLAVFTRAVLAACACEGSVIWDGSNVREEPGMCDLRGGAMLGLALQA